MIGNDPAVDEFDFDRAMRMYLGGDRDSSIQIGGGDERLKASFGSGATVIKVQLDALLDAVVRRVVDERVTDNRSVYSWLAEELPSLSDVCRVKISAYAFYYLVH
jgi:hypothetical protein